MTTFELLQITIYFTVITIYLTIFGAAVWQFITSRFHTSILNLESSLILGTSYLIGVGTFTTLMLFIGLFKFDLQSLTSVWIFTVIFIIFQKSTIFDFVNQRFRQILKFEFKNPGKQLLYSTLISLSTKLIYLILIFSILAIIATLYLSSLQFPFVSDELSYHLPQAQQMVEEKRIDPFFGGHFFYGSIPKLLEILFAIGILLHGLQFTHLFHFSIFIAFLLILYGLISSLFNIRTAILSVFLILQIDEFRTNAMIAFIDAGTTSFELSALLLFILWIKLKNNALLVASSFSVGFALASKYSALFTSSFILFLFLLNYYFSGKKLEQRIVTKRILLLNILIVLFSCSYWYLKNLYFYSNPTFPLYFGHKGVSDQNYLSLIQAIQEFGPRDPISFVKLPLRYFDLYNLTIFFSIISLPIYFLIHQHKSIIRILAVFIALFLPYWFFLATHQTRFLTPALVIAAILFSIILINSSKTLKLTLILYLLLSTLLANWIKPLPKESPINVMGRVIDYRLHLTYRQYGLGNIDKETSLNRFLGCQYAVINYLEQNNLEGNVLDNWTVWQDISASFYAKRNKFRNSALDSNLGLKNELEKYGIKYIYVKDINKITFKDKKDPIESEYYLKRINIENELLLRSDQIFQYLDCHLYKIRFEQL